jgi:hypothetical protein
MRDKRAKNEKLHKSQRMWYINSLKNEVDETILFIVSGIFVISGTVS